MSRVSNIIPLNKQDAGAIGGLEISHFTYEESSSHSRVLSSHRDDYYVLMIATKGNGIFQCDMEQIRFKANSIFLIRPYQVHAASEISRNAGGYFISIAPFVMPDHCHNIFERLPVSKQYLRLSPADKKPLIDTIALLHQAFKETNNHKTFIIHSLFNALINRVATIFSDASNNVVVHRNQSQLITQNFQKLITEYGFLNSPSFFSEKLNISTSHLNDCVKSTTGISVTHYLQHAMLVEAKRHLYYTNDDVKRIAFALGFEDHAYFSRLFKKLTQETPLSFRSNFRE